MTVQQAVEAVKKLQRTMHAHSHAQGLIYLDSVTAAPEDTAEARGHTLGVLSEEDHALFVNDSVRETLATTLSALGDSFFSGTLLPLWSLLSISLLLAGFTNIAMLLAVILFGSLLLFRAICFVSGLRYGLTTLARLRKLNLINWVDRLKMVNAALAALVIWHLPISTMKPFPWTAYAMGAAAVLAAAWLVGRMRLPRLLLWAVTTGALILVDLGFIGM